MAGVKHFFGGETTVTVFLALEFFIYSVNVSNYLLHVRSYRIKQIIFSGVYVHKHHFSPFMQSEVLALSFPVHLIIRQRNAYFATKSIILNYIFVQDTAHIIDRVFSLHEGIVYIILLETGFVYICIFLDLCIKCVPDEMIKIKFVYL